MLEVNKFDNPVSIDYSDTPPIKINLQLFAEEGGEAATGGEASNSDSEIPVNAAEETSQSISDLTGKVQEFFNATMNPPAAIEQDGQVSENNQENGKTGTEQTEEGVVNKEQQKEEPLILGKFKSQAELEKAYVNLESFTTQTRQELAQLRQMLENQQKQVDEPEKATDEEEAEKESEDSEAFLNEFYAKPKETIMKMAESIAKKMVEPIYREREERARQEKFNAIALQFKKEHPDMVDYSEDMVKFLEDNKEIANKENAIELAYNYAKGLRVQKQKSPDDLLEDPEFIQKILSNEKIRNEMLKATAAEAKKGSPPPVISGNISGNGRPVAVPPTQPKTFKEAGQMMLKSLGLSN